MSEQDDVRTIRSIAVTAEDVVDAFVYSRENPGRAVLRLTSPFHGRMRARLHVYHVDDASKTGAIHLDPARLLDDSVVNGYPAAEEVVDHFGDGSPAEHRAERGQAIERWRGQALEAIVDSVVLDVDGSDHEVHVKRMG